jgi:hypothetical protein
VLNKDRLFSELAAIAGAVTESDLLERMREAESTEELLEALGNATAQ